MSNTFEHACAACGAVNTSRVEQLGTTVLCARCGKPILILTVPNPSDEDVEQAVRQELQVLVGRVVTDAQIVTTEHGPAILILVGDEGIAIGLSQGVRIGRVEREKEVKQ